MNRQPPNMPRPRKEPRIRLRVDRSKIPEGSTHWIDLDDQQMRDIVRAAMSQFEDGTFRFSYERIDYNFRMRTGIRLAGGGSKALVRKIAPGVDDRRRRNTGWIPPHVRPYQSEETLRNRRAAIAANAANRKALPVVPQVAEEVPLEKPQAADQLHEFEPADAGVRPVDHVAIDEHRDDRD